MSPNREPRHVSVLPEETLRWLDPQPGETWIDATLGGGGHARLIAAKLIPGGRLLGLDQDPAMLERAAPGLKGLPIERVHAVFDQLDAVLEARGIEAIDGLFADLGFSSDQLEDPTRGLSFRDDGPLDMRLNPATGMTAARYVNELSEAALADVIWEYGEERFSRRIAKRIVERRREKPFATTADLAEIVRQSVPRTPDTRRIHPATRTFQALRIAVNDEMGSLERLLALLPRFVKPGGRVGIISFHSLEDRRVKQAFRDHPAWEPLTKKPVEPGDDEARRNPRARSAKLRVARRV